MKFILVDTEYTTWPGALESSWAGRDREIVQMAAIRIDNGREIAALNLLVKPVFNPDLSDLFLEITQLSAQDIEQGLTFAKAFQQFQDFCQDVPVVCMNADEAVFRENCRLHGLDFSLASWHRLRPFLETQNVDTQRHSSGDLHSLTDTPLKGHTHNALHDVRSMHAWMQHAQRLGTLTSLDLLPTGAPDRDPRAKAEGRSMEGPPPS